MAVSYDGGGPDGVVNVKLATDLVTATNVGAATVPSVAAGLQVAVAKRSIDDRGRVYHR